MKAQLSELLKASEQRFVTTEENLKELLTDNEGHVHKNGIPPPLIQRNHIDELKMNAQRLMPENFLEAVFKADTTMFQPIYDVNSDRIVFNNVALIGDAAFVARPHVGVGVLKAAQDAISLATSLSECRTISEALTRYENERFIAKGGEKTIITQLQGGTKARVRLLWYGIGNRV